MTVANRTTKHFVRRSAVAGLCAVLCGALLASCETSYVPRSSGDGFGYSDFQLSKTSFQVDYQGNGNTSLDTAYKFFLTRAADLALGHHYTGFYITKLDKPVPETVVAPGYSTTVAIVPHRHFYPWYGVGGVATISSYSPGQVYELDVPGYSGNILLVNQPIKGQPQPFDARLIYNQGMTLKHDIDSRNTAIGVAVWIASLAVLGAIVASTSYVYSSSPGAW